MAEHKEAAWQILYVKVPEPQVTEECFSISTYSEEHTVSDGQVLIRLTHVSVDPYMRGLMNKESYTGGVWSTGQNPYGFCAGVVEETKASNFSVGDRVIGVMPWKAKVVLPAAQINKVPSNEISPSLFMSTLGMTGLSAYFPFKKYAQIKAGDVVFVSGAAGAVGSIFGQLAKNAGATVYGSAGGSDKVDLVKSLGFDDAFDYKKVSPKEGLDALLNGKTIDVYFDNVGGETLDAALARMSVKGRIICCGMISQYNLSPEETYGLKNAMNIVTKQLSVNGFIVSQWLSEFPEGVMEMLQLYLGKKITHIETVVQGYDKIPKSLVGLFHGANTGKMIVQVSEL